MRALILLFVWLIQPLCAAESSYLSDLKLELAEAKKGGKETDHLMNKLLVYAENTNSVDAFKFLGKQYLFAGYVAQDIKLAKEYLLKANPTEDSETGYLLGTLIISFFKHELDSGISFLISSAENGNTKAMYNLYVLSSRDVYLDKKKAFSYLLQSHQAGDEDSSLLLAQEMLNSARISKDAEVIERAILILQGQNIEKNKDSASFMLSQIYGNEDFSIYDQELRDHYLQKAAEMGHDLALEFWTEYQKMLKDEH